MEALEFLKEYNRMCTMYKSCRGCPLEMDNCAGCGDEFSEKQIINIIDKTEQWSKEHPIITNARKFKEVFGFMPAGCQKFYFVEPNGAYSKTINWQEPYKEPEHEL